MENSWENLNNPPIVVALFQMKYVADNLELNRFISCDVPIKHHLPIRKDSGQSNLTVTKTMSM